MKISTLVLSISALFILYICYAEWIDEVIEVLADKYLGSDYEEVAPFIPSVHLGAEEFDNIVQELSRKSRVATSPYLVWATLLSLIVLPVAIRLIHRGKGYQLLRGSLPYVSSKFEVDPDEKSGKCEVRSLIAEILGRRGWRTRPGQTREDVPLQVIWKGNNLIESSVRCSLKDGATHGKPTVKSSDLGGGDDLAEEVTPSSSNDSTVQRLAEIRRLLESESEIPGKLREKPVGKEDFPGRKMTELRERLESDVDDGSKTKGNAPSKPFTLRTVQGKPRDTRSGKADKETPVSVDASTDSLSSSGDDRSGEDGDPKLMNRIRLLESRLRLEELKNRNWITRMSRAEGILQQLNKQVERIERSRPGETTLMETLKITSTVTNWMPVTKPRAPHHLQFTFVKRYPQNLLQPRTESLSEYIRREVPLPFTCLDPKRLLSLPKSPLAPAMPPPIIAPQTSILSKLLSK